MQEEKTAALMFLLHEVIPNPRGILIFVATRFHADYLTVGSSCELKRSRF